MKKFEAILKQKMKKNSKIISDNERKIQLIKANCLEKKLLDILGFSLPPYLVFFVLYVYLLSVGQLELIINFMSFADMSLISFACSGGLGIVGFKLFEWNIKKKRKEKVFPISKRESDRLASEVECEVELRKAKYRNDAFKVMLESYNSDKKLLKKIQMILQMMFLELGKNVKVK